ncbi:MAG TPA: hypothetical protein PKX94_08955, partial [Opitutales bacterium]|nr:hypothetical protein [Opitutales bacterium]
SPCAQKILQVPRFQSLSSIPAPEMIHAHEGINLANRRNNGLSFHNLTGHLSGIFRNHRTNPSSILTKDADS